MQKEKYKVSAVRCSSYKSEEVKKSLQSSLENIDFSFKKGMKVLIKPNILRPASPNEAITTHPMIIEELCKMLKKQNCKIYIGDSSGTDTQNSLKKCGIQKLRKYGKILNFDTEEKKFLDLGTSLARVPMPKILFDVDLIINVPKMKTHTFTQVTLAVKNLYGCIPGEAKSHFHKIFNHPREFSKMLLKIEDTLKPQLNILDGVTGLEGNGPGTTGEKNNPKVILASRSARALDMVASEMMGFNSKSILTCKLSGIRKEDIEVLGNGKDLKLKFKKPKTNNLGFLFFLNNVFPKPKIAFDKEKCQKCNLCKEKCPVKAISLETGDKFPQCSNKKCIRCLCCLELCPYKAVSLQDHWTKRGLKTAARKVLKMA